MQGSYQRHLNQEGLENIREDANLDRVRRTADDEVYPSKFLDRLPNRVFKLVRVPDICLRSDASAPGSF